MLRCLTSTNIVVKSSQGMSSRQHTTAGSQSSAPPMRLPSFLLSLIAAETVLFRHRQCVTGFGTVSFSAPTTAQVIWRAALGIQRMFGRLPNWFITRPVDPARVCRSWIAPTRCFKVSQIWPAMASFKCDPSADAGSVFGQHKVEKSAAFQPCSAGSPSTAVHAGIPQREKMPSGSNDQASRFAESYAIPCSRWLSASLPTAPAQRLSSFSAELAFSAI